MSNQVHLTKKAAHVGGRVVSISEISKAGENMEPPLVPGQGEPSCAYMGCHELVSGWNPKTPELAFLCTKHRRAVTTRRARNQAAEVPLLTPDREGAAKLFEHASEYHAFFTMVTPAVALALLERNTKNRSIAPERVATYARDMLLGVWRPNSQGIALGADGILYDGQHRLAAVVQARKPVNMLIVSGLLEESRATIDQGRRRTLGDNLRILDGERHGPRIVSWLRVIDLMLSNRSRSCSTHTARLEIARYRSSLDWVIRLDPKKPIDKVAVVGAFVYAHHAAGARVEPLLEKYLSGADLPPGEPILTLRNYVLSRQRYSREKTRDTSLKALRCIQLSLRGEKLEKLASTSEGLDYFTKMIQKVAPASPPKE